VKISLTTFSPYQSESLLGAISSSVEGYRGMVIALTPQTYKNFLGEKRPGNDYATNLVGALIDLRYFSLSIVSLQGKVFCI